MVLADPPVQVFHSNRLRDWRLVPMVMAWIGLVQIIEHRPQMVPFSQTVDDLGFLIFFSLLALMPRTLSVHPNGIFVICNAWIFKKSFDFSHVETIHDSPSLSKGLTLSGSHMKDIEFELYPWHPNEEQIRSEILRRTPNAKQVGRLTNAIQRGEQFQLPMYQSDPNFRWLTYGFVVLIALPSLAILFGMPGTPGLLLRDDIDPFFKVLCLGLLTLLAVFLTSELRNLERGKTVLRNKLNFIADRLEIELVGAPPLSLPLGVTVSTQEDPPKWNFWDTEGKILAQFPTNGVAYNPDLLWQEAEALGLVRLRNRSGANHG